MDLKEQLKKEGLSMAENYLRLMLNDVERLGKIVVDATDNPFDDVGFQALMMFKSTLLEAIDKIDGEEG